MTKTLIFLLTFGLLFNSCSKQNDISEEEVYNILNGIIADDSLHIFRLYSKFSNLTLTPDLEKHFTSDDIKFIKSQNVSSLNTRIRPNKLICGVKNYQTKSKDFIKVDTVFYEGIVYYFSFPIISKDRKTVLIEITEDCNAMLCGFNGKFLYVKTNGKWTLKKKIDFIVS